MQQSKLTTKPGVPGAKNIMDPSGAGSKRKTVQLVEPERAAPEMQMAPAVGKVLLIAPREFRA